MRWREGEVSGRLIGRSGSGVLLAHGAGVDQDHPRLVSLRDALAGHGLTVMTFNYPYRERGARRPDPLPRLLACHRAAADLLTTRVDEVFLAGRSMGGRVATQLAAEAYPAAGVILYAYPLHPAGKEDQLRIDHLGKVSIPMLFFQGTGDALSRMELFDRHIRPRPGVTVEILEGADHGFRIRGVDPAAVTDRLASVTAAWIGGHSSGTRGRVGA